MNRVDLQGKYKSYYTVAEQSEMGEISEASYVAILGEENPGAQTFCEKEGITAFCKRTEKALLRYISGFQQLHRRSLLLVRLRRSGYLNCGFGYLSKTDINQL